MAAATSNADIANQAASSQSMLAVPSQRMHGAIGGKQSSGALAHLPTKNGDGSGLHGETLPTSAGAWACPVRSPKARMTRPLPVARHFAGALWQRGHSLDDHVSLSGLEAHDLIPRPCGRLLARRHPTHWQSVAGSTRRTGSTRELAKPSTRTPSTTAPPDRSAATLQAPRGRAPSRATRSAAPAHPGQSPQPRPRTR